MTKLINLLALYLHLAQASQRRRRPFVRDRLLVIAGSMAARMKLPRIDRCCRQLVLDHNPGHALQRWPDIATALEDSDFLHLLKQHQRRFPAEKVERMVAELGIRLENERDAYYSDEEYAASILGFSLERLDQFGE